MSDVIEKKPRTIVRELKNAVFYSDDSIFIKNVRLSYPHLDKPSSFTDRDGKASRPTYRATFLIPKTAEYRPLIEALRERIAKVMSDKKIERLAADRKCLRDGDLTEKPEDRGMWILSANEKDPPILRDRRRNRVRTEDAGKLFYGGCWVHGLVKMWGQSNEFGKRVNANLVAVQFVRDDKAFGTGRITEDDIDDTFPDMGDDESGYEEDDGKKDDDNYDDL